MSERAHDAKKESRGDESRRERIATGELKKVAGGFNPQPEPPKQQVPSWKNLVQRYLKY